MKNIITIGLLVSLFLSSTLFSENIDIKTQINQVPMLRANELQVEKVIVYDNVYHFKARSTGKNPGTAEGFLTKDLNTLILGKAYNASTMQEYVMPFDIDVEKLKSLAAYKTGNGKDSYFVFTDPECPYCQRLENQMSGVKSNVTLYTILFPLDFHKNAKSMCRYILSQKSDELKEKAMKEIANKGTQYTKATYSATEIDKFDANIQNSLNEVNKIGINGTPTIINAQGIKVSPEAIIERN